MNTDDPLQRAIGEWQRKHHIADGDPMIATLDLVRLYLEHNGAPRDDAPLPSFEDFRGTIELLDRRSKSFINQAYDLVSEMRRFGQNVKTLHRAHVTLLRVFIGCASLLGFLISRLLCLRTCTTLPLARCG